MNEKIRQKLCELIAQYGFSLCNDQKRCEILLENHCGQSNKDVFILTAALKNRVVEDLINASPSALKYALYKRLINRLENELGLKKQTAQWAVESWALALGVLEKPIFTSTEKSHLFGKIPGAKEEIKVILYPQKNRNLLYLKIAGILLSILIFLIFGWRYNLEKNNQLLHIVEENNRLSRQESQQKIQAIQRLAEEAAQRKIQEAQRLAEEETQRKARETEEAAQRKIQEAQRLAEEETQRKARETEEAAQRKIQEAQRLAEEETQRKARETEEAAQRKIQEAQRLAEEETQRKARETEEAAQRKSIVKPKFEVDPLVKEIQKQLLFLGYSPGPIDGHIGDKTLNAIKIFQQENGFLIDIKINEELLFKLKESQPRRVVEKKQNSRIIKSNNNGNNVENSQNNTCPIGQICVNHQNDQYVDMQYYQDQKQIYSEPKKTPSNLKNKNGYKVVCPTSIFCFRQPVE